MVKKFVESVKGAETMMTAPLDPMTTKWCQKNGSLNARGVKIKNRIMEFLDEQSIDVAYSNIKAHLMANFPDDYNPVPTKMGEQVDTSKLLSNGDIKFICQILETEGKVIDDPLRFQQLQMVKAQQK